MRTMKLRHLLSVIVALESMLICAVTHSAPIQSIEPLYADGTTDGTTLPGGPPSTQPTTEPTTTPSTAPTTAPFPPPFPPPFPLPPTPVLIQTLITTPGGLNAVKWNGTRELVLSGSGTFDLSHQTIPAGSSISVRSSDATHPATIKIPGDVLPTLNVSGYIKIINCKIDGGDKGVLVQTHGNANADLENLTGDSVCLFWGEGGATVTILNCSVPGRPSQYGLCNFDAPLASLHVSGCTLAQGPNQACVRLMRVNQSLIEHCTFVGADTKQCIQDRSGGTHTWNNVTVRCTAGHSYSVDIGPMTWQDYSTAANTPQSLALSQWINCTLPDYPQVERPGNRKTVQRIVYQNCTIGGQKNMSKDFN